MAEIWLAAKSARNIHRERGGDADETQAVGVIDGKETVIEVKAHGATAFTSLAAGAADVGMASRQINPDEAADLQSKGLSDLTSNVNERVLGLDGGCRAPEVGRCGAVASLARNSFCGNWRVFVRV